MSPGGSPRVARVELPDFGMPATMPEVSPATHARLSIDLHPDVLPFSNLPAVLPPFLMRPDRAMTWA